MKLLIGKSDKADFPELLLSDLSIKVDTGAYTSAIHTHEIEEFVQNEEKLIKFKVLDPMHPQYNTKEFVTKNYIRKRVKNSFGKSENRFVVQTVIVLFGKEFPIDLSLSERGEMKFPILIGRKLLNGRFIVDTSKKDLSYKLKNKILSKKQ